MGSRRIVLATFEVPGYGGAASNRYQLFERMQRDGHDVAYVNLIDPRDRDYFRYELGDGCGNPRGLDAVRDCVLEPDLFGPQPGLARILKELGPEVLVGNGFVAARLLRAAAPETRCVFFTTGCWALKRLIDVGAARDCVSFLEKSGNLEAPPAPARNPEARAVADCDLIVAHSPLVRRLYELFYPDVSGKLRPGIAWMCEPTYAEAEQDCAGLRRAFDDRDIDVLFVASDWARPEKNAKLVGEIAARCPDLRIHVVGKWSEPLPSVRHHGFLASREALWSLLARTRAVACPSRFDASPAVLFEGSAMGCNGVASANCGNLELCHPDLRVARADAAGFAEKIRLAAAAPYQDRAEVFRREDGYDEFVETLSVFT